MQFRLKYEICSVEPDGRMVMPTGSWRYQRPVTKVNKCCQCGWCYLWCPTGSIEDNGSHFAADLTYCKGCGLCASVCPNDAIMLVREEQDANEG